MSGQEPALFDAKPEKARMRGAAQSALEVTLKAWRTAGHLADPAHASARRLLRDAALAVDAARHAVQLPRRCPTCSAGVPDAWAGSPYTLAMTDRILNDLLAAHAPPASTLDTWESADDDEIGDQVAAWLAGASEPDAGPVGPH